MLLTGPGSSLRLTGADSSLATRALASKRFWQQSRPLRPYWSLSIRPLFERIWPSACFSPANQIEQAQPEAASVPRSDLSQRLRQARTALGWQHLVHEEVVVNGTGHHLGEAVAWQLRWRGDGAFAEHIQGQHLTFRWGYEGGAAGTTWEVDSSNVSRRLELDDREAMILSVWVRIGYWLQSQASSVINIRAAAASEEQQNGPDEAAPATGPGTVSCPSAPSAGAPHGSNVHDASDSQPQQEAGVSTGSTWLGPYKDGSAESAVDADLILQLHRGKMRATLMLDEQNHLPANLTHPICGQQEDWAYHDWQSWSLDGQRSLIHPGNVKHRAAAGGNNEYIVEGVRPTIDGQQLGWMLLDTGASGGVITKAAADKLA
ncbi:hypothetical protein WJX84_004145 [Apatococcus fuscideae]|uniref:Uncharacterized protein n=1 Tax=Apatococcus fuscideae TaxID=2026836 RepID=A0AAW1SL77_9CHLO